MASLSFAHQIALDEPAVEPLLVSLAAAFAPVDEVATHAAVSVLATRLDGVGTEPAARLAALGERVAGSFRRPSPVGCPSTLDDLLLPTVLTDRRGDELLVAIATVIAGHRRGWDVGVVRAGDRFLVAHAGLLPPMVVSVRDEGRVLDARDLAAQDDLWWCEPHGLADLALGLLRARGEGVGLHQVVLRAAQLGCTLAQEPQEHLRRAVDLARARARFN